MPNQKRKKKKKLKLIFVEIDSESNSQLVKNLFIVPAILLLFTNTQHTRVVICIHIIPQLLKS